MIRGTVKNIGVSPNIIAAELGVIAMEADNRHLPGFLASRSGTCVGKPEKVMLCAKRSWGAVLNCEALRV